jgi:two-component system OmpR family sensor kinase
LSRSLQRHLSRTLVLTIVLAGLVAASAAFVFAYMEAQDFQDDTLRQIVAFAQTQANAPAFEGGGTLADEESRLIVRRLPRDPRPQWLPVDLPGGFHTLPGPEGRLRVFMQPDGRGGWIVAAQATDVRDEAAIDSGLLTLAPALLLLPLLVWLTVRIVRRELAPVRRMARIVDQQSAERLQPLPGEDVPDEIAPFVHAINRMLERVNAQIAGQRRFIADAAHELRSPLTALSLQAQNMDKAESLEIMRKRAAPLRAGIDRARRLTEQLLSLARTQAQSVAAEPVDVSKMARGLIAEYLPLAEARGIDLGLEDASHTVLVADPKLLHLVLKNALDNALRYTPVHSEVTLRLYAEGKDAVIEVIDSGPGVPADERDRVFDPFYRIEGAGGEGSGLGLAIVRDAAKRLGGSVSLHDRSDGPGLVFRYRQCCVPRPAPARIRVDG